MGSYEELIDRTGAFAEFIKQYLSQTAVDDTGDDDSESTLTFKIYVIMISLMLVNKIYFDNVQITYRL